MVADRAAPAARRFTGALLLTGFAVTLLVLLEALVRHGAGTDGWQLAARHTARVSVCFFLLVALARPLADLHGSRFLRACLRERRGLGLAFFGAHGVHLAGILGFAASGGAIDPLTLAGGGIAYVLLAGMAATSSDAAVRRLGARGWKRLHRAGLWYLWLIFVASYLGRVLEPRPAAQHLLLLAALLGVALLRAFAWRRRRRRAATAR